MNQQQRELILKLRAQGMSYGKIAAAAGLSSNTVKSFCRRNPTGGLQAKTVAVARPERCPQCNSLLEQTSGHRQKRFCSEKCRRLWWAAHPEQMNRKTFCPVTCLQCGKSFLQYGTRPRKFCSRPCYLAHRYGKVKEP